MSKNYNPKLSKRQRKPTAPERGHHLEESSMELEYNELWQTKARGSNSNEYEIYLACADDGNGNDITTGKPLKTYDEWINS